MKRFCLRLLLSTAAALLVSCAQPGFRQHADLLRADHSSAPARVPAQPPANGVRVTYFGTNSFLLQSRGGSVLVDPYFSRVGPLLQVALGKRIAPDRQRIAEGLARLPAHVDYIVVTHAHVDHLFDVAEVARRTGAKVILSRTGFYQASAAGLPRARMIVPQTGRPVGAGGLRITAFPGDHSRLLGLDLYEGTRTAEPTSLDHIGDWKAGETLIYLIEMGGRRIFLSSGSRQLLPPASVAPVDLALLGLSLKESRQLFPAIIQRTRPRVIQPTHQDDFARPLSDGFYFGLGADMTGVRRQWQDLGRPGDLILLDYYKPWTLR
jgi:L-ascorbate metabolism protein UlaG (beta-lactamase superfamily)